MLDAAIRAQRYDGVGNPVGGEMAIAVTAGYDQVLPAVTALADGGCYATWTELVDNITYILGSDYDANGAPAGPATTP